MSCNTFDSIGSKFSPRILTPDQAFQRVMSVDQRITYDKDPLLRHDIALMTSALSNLIAKLPDNYPIITARQDVDPLTPRDFAEFVEWGGYTDDDIYNISILPLPLPQVITVFDLLEYYLDPNFAKRATGNSCAVLVNKLAQIIGFLSAGAKLINELKNFSLAGVIARLNGWKVMLQQMVDELKDRILSMINNFVDQIKSYAFQINGSLARFMKKAHKVKQFLSDLSVQSIKDKIEEVIAKLAGQFEELTPEAMLHLLMVICQLSDSITSFMQSPLDLLKNSFNAFTLAEFGLKQFTNERVSGSVSNGLPRMAPDLPATIIDEAASTNGKLRNPVFSADERTFLATLLNSTSGSVSIGDVTINHAANPVADEKSGRGGWTYVINHHPGIYVVAFRIAKALGKPLTINCAYRSPTKNAELAKTTTGVAKNSLHMRGMALDISGANLTANERALLIKLASREGVGGIGHYPNSNTKFTHIDLGNTRTWGGGNPSLIAEAIANHVGGANPKFTPEEAAKLPSMSPDNRR